MFHGEQRLHLGLLFLEPAELGVESLLVQFLRKLKIHHLVYHMIVQELMNLFYFGKVVFLKRNKLFLGWAVERRKALPKTLPSWLGLFAFFHVDASFRYYVSQTVPLLDLCISWLVDFLERWSIEIVSWLHVLETFVTVRVDERYSVMFHRPWGWGMFSWLRLVDRSNVDT